MASDVWVDLHQREIDALVHDPRMRDVLLDAAGPVVQVAQVRAPHRSGRGAASIRAEAVLDGPELEVRISWDRDHFYMYFHDRGTRHLPARRFLESTLEGMAR